MTDEAAGLANSELAKNLRSTDRMESTAGFFRLGASMGRGEQIEELVNPSFRKNIWKQIVSIADKHNQPGTFTTFPAYEWTVAKSYLDNRAVARNLHRNIIFRSSVE